MKFARYVFLAAGIYGILVILPLYFTLEKLSRDYPPAVTHPEYYYAFAGVTLVWQFLFLWISRDPLRYRSIMPFCFLEKLPLVPAYFILAPQGLFPAMWIPLMFLDLTFGVLFLVSYFATRTDAQTAVVS